jgi:hypothetical protein
MKKDFTPKSRKENLVIQELEDEVLVYDLVKNKALCLNQTSALVWQASDGSRTIADITDFVGKQLKSQVSEDLVWLAIDQLSKDNLIENKEDFKENKFAGLSRREAVRKLGMASLVALPVIASLTAPVAAQTGTCNNVSCNCTGPRQPDGSCTSTTCQVGCTCRATNPAGNNGNCLA